MFNSNENKKLETEEDVEVEQEAITTYVPSKFHFSDAVKRFGTQDFPNTVFTHLDYDRKSQFHPVDYTKVTTKSLEEIDQEATDSVERFERTFRARRSRESGGAAPGTWRAFAPGTALKSWSRDVKDDEHEIKGYDDLPPSACGKSGASPCQQQQQNANSQGGFFQRLANKLFGSSDEE
mmetsp:Transcript_11282/g.42259  ORF Transcript_11282/g.42259 Transcript_11282/m.42259 type:complete len:179 (+) Transcript_11282:2047-2583(+)